MIKTDVSNNEILYRRVQFRYTDPNPDGSRKVGATGFRDPDCRPSVDRAKFHGYDPRKTQISKADGVTSLLAQDIRAINSVVQNNQKGQFICAYGIDIEHVPLEKNNAHAEIYMDPTTSNRNVFRRLMESLAYMANERGWEIEPSECQDSAESQIESKVF